MAGERKGKTYEAVVFAALTELVAQGPILGPLHWNARPAKINLGGLLSGFVPGGVSPTNPESKDPQCPES